MKHTETELKKKTKKELIAIILDLQNDPFSILQGESIPCIADGTKGMERGK